MHILQAIGMQNNMQIITQQGQDPHTTLCMEDFQSSENPNYKHKLHYQALKDSILVLNALYGTPFLS